MKWAYGFLALLIAAVGLLHADESIRLRILPPVYLDEQGAGLKNPEGIACDGASLLVVADTGNGRLVTYRVARDTVSPVRSIRLSQLPYPMQVQVAPGGGLAVLDGKLRRIARLAPSGEFMNYVEVAGDTAARAMVPRSFRVDAEGRVYILDIANARVLVVDSREQLVRQIALPDGPASYADLVVDARGAVFVLESVHQRVFHAGRDDEAFAPFTASLAEVLAFPTSLTLDEAGRFYIADRTDGGIVVLEPDGSFRGRQSSMGWRSGALRYPSALCVDSAGTMFVADRGNNRIQIFAIVVKE